MKTLMILLMVVAVDQEPVWMTDFEAAKAMASTEHKYILLNFSGSDWCAPCIKLKKEVFESEAFARLASSRMVLVRADFPRAKKNQLPRDLVAHNEALAEVYNPQGNFPYTLLLDAEGRVLKVWDGYVFATQDQYLVDLEVASSK